MTPMELVVSTEDWSGCDIWLFSAGAGNPDISAAWKSAVASLAVGLHLVTVNRHGATANAAAIHPSADLHVLPVADPKDGFLSTHSLCAMVVAILLAGDSLVEHPRADELMPTLLREIASALDPMGRAEAAAARFCEGDTVVVLHDPRLSTVGLLIETSLWETGIAPVQRTDFRNFAHGRHVWAARHPSSMFVLSLNSLESRAIWAPVDILLPREIRRGSLDFENAGRFRNAIGVFEGLSLIRALGSAVSIDPGRPGRGDFAKPIYEDSALDTLSELSTAAVRQKVQANRHHDSADERGMPMHESGRDRLAELADACFAGIVLDYDGTVVATDARLEPPDAAVVNELVRLIDAGVAIGIATGRGGSAGEMLRSVVPSAMHDLIVVGYYNGAHIAALSVDIRDRPPLQDELLSDLADWIDDQKVLIGGRAVKRGRVQLTVNHADLKEVAAFTSVLGRHPAISDGLARVLSSHHSFDIMPARTSKLAVVAAIATARGNAELPILRIGDSGSTGGNDHELLCGPHGVSVDSVCDKEDGCWSIFGKRLAGPEALLRILQAARPLSGSFRLDVDYLTRESERPNLHAPEGTPATRTHGMETL